uniref:Putative NADH kinase n=1 Tax=Anthurium amnicola TaxID=1678845 RepID=A0A1D1Y3L6_9ARAE
MSVLRRWRVLLVLKPFDVYPPRPVPTLEEPFSSSAAPQRVPNPKILRYLDDRCKVHKETISFCQDVLQQKSLEWQSMLRNNLSQPIRDVDIVVTVGGDGTLLQASHFMDGTIPVIGVNSDPTQSEEVTDVDILS